MFLCFNRFYRVLPSFTGISRSVSWVLPSFTGFCRYFSWVLSGLVPMFLFLTRFTGFYLVLLGFPVVFLGLYRFLPSFTGFSCYFSWILSGLVVIFLVLPRFTVFFLVFFPCLTWFHDEVISFYLVLLSFTRVNPVSNFWMLVDFSCCYWFLPSFHFQLNFTGCLFFSLNNSW